MMNISDYPTAIGTLIYLKWTVALHGLLRGFQGGRCHLADQLVKLRLVRDPRQLHQVFLHLSIHLEAFIVLIPNPYRN